MRKNAIIGHNWFRLPSRICIGFDCRKLMTLVVGPFAVAQFVFSIPIIIPIFYWLSLKIFRIDESNASNLSLDEEEICIILPMRNEVSNVERKLDSIIDEILPYEFVSLIVADSNSNDGTKEMVERYLAESKLFRSRWLVKRLEISGKNFALNTIIPTINANIVVISDADANVSPGWLDIIRSRMMEEDVAVVSGIELEGRATGFNSYYREKSNWLRCRESEIGSTPVLEGSILAWKTSALGSFVLDERMNADDAQIGFLSLRSGHRSIVDSRITFRDFVVSDRTFGESVRRSQGLSLALMKNADLAFFNQSSASRKAIFNALILYVIFPWSLLLFILNAMASFYMSPHIGNTWYFYSFSMFLLLIIIPKGRYLLRGVAISIIAQIQAIIGIRHHTWNPVR